MNENEFNKLMESAVEEFIQEWIGLVDQYAEDNELGVNHKLTCLLYSHVGIERALSDRVWKMGSKYIHAVIEVAKELRKHK